jgi:cytochrome c biogenesis protein CcmG/thiol:disulfide interchange protein DsbE
MRCVAAGSLVLVLSTVWIGTAFSATAPDFNLRSPDGKRLNLHDMLEGGPVLLDFWATYCKPCVKAMPKLQALHKKYESRGLTVLGVNEDGPRSQTKVPPFLRARKISFPIALDTDGGVMRRMQVGALPTTILIGQDGEVLFRQAGYDPKMEVALEKLLDALPDVTPEEKENAVDKN